MSDRREFLRTSVLAAAGVATANALGETTPAALPGEGFGEAAAGAGKKPNIILILADDMGYSDLGCFGSEISTPNLDRLAANGLRLSQFYNSPRCCPSRAALMSGLYSHQAHMGMMTADAGRYPFVAYEGSLSKSCVTIAEALKPAGYTTLMSGKWHLTPNDQTTKPDVDKTNWPLQRGYDKFYGIIGGATNYYDPTTLVRQNDPIRELAPDFYFTTDGIAANASKMIAESPKDKPFFLYLAFNAPHWPLQAPEATVAKYRARYHQGWDKMRETRHAKQIQMNLLEAKWPLTARDPRVAAWERASFKDWEAERMAVYAAQVDLMDQGIGQVLAVLEERGEMDNTLIMFMVDNGGNYEEIGTFKPTQKRPGYMTETTKDGKPVVPGNVPSILPGPATTYASYGGPWGNVSNTPFRLYKHFANEGGISSPMIMHWPAGIKGKNVINAQIGHEIDVMPTCLAVAGATYPTTSKAGTPPLTLEGKSLLPVLRNGGSLPDRGMLFWEHEGNCAVRDGKWKLVSAWPNNWELYDMDADRTEMHDLVDVYPDQVNRLSAAYLVWAKRVGAQPWPMPQTPVNERGGNLGLPDYMKADRPGWLRGKDSPPEPAPKE